MNSNYQLDPLRETPYRLWISNVCTTDFKQKMDRWREDNTTTTIHHFITQILSNENMHSSKLRAPQFPWQGTCAGFNEREFDFFESGEKMLVKAKIQAKNRPARTREGKFEIFAIFFSSWLFLVHAASGCEGRRYPPRVVATNNNELEFQTIHFTGTNIHK